MQKLPLDLRRVSEGQTECRQQQENPAPRLSTAAPEQDQRNERQGRDGDVDGPDADRDSGAYENDPAGAPAQRVAKTAADGQQQHERADVVADRGQIVGQVVACRRERQADRQEPRKTPARHQQPGDPTGGQRLSEPGRAEDQMHRPDGLRRGQRQAARKGVEAPQRSDDRRKRGHDGHPRACFYTERRRHGKRNQIGIRQGREIDQPDTIGEGIDD